MPSMLAIPIIATVLSVMPSAVLAVVLAIAAAPLSPDDVHNGPLAIRIRDIPNDGTFGNGRINPVVIRAIAVVLIIFVFFILALCWLQRRRPTARSSMPQVRQPSRATSMYSTRALVTYSENMTRSYNRPGSNISGSTLLTGRDEYIGNSPVSILVPAEAHVNSSSTAGMQVPRAVVF